jgi:hypothetical protein
MADPATVTKQTKNRTAFGIRFLGIMLILVFVGAFLFFALRPGWLYPREVSVRQL